VARCNWRAGRPGAVITPLGRDQLAISSLARLRALGLACIASRRSPLAHSVTLLDGPRERTIVTFGPPSIPPERTPSCVGQLPRRTACTSRRETWRRFSAARRSRRARCQSARAARARARRAPGRARAQRRHAIERRAARRVAEAELVVYKPKASAAAPLRRARRAGILRRCPPPRAAVRLLRCGARRRRPHVRARGRMSRRRRSRWCPLRSRLRERPRPYEARLTLGGQ